MSGIHPDAAELQSHADGEAVDERVASHVESCAACREEVAAIRRVTAALSLGSTASESLTARIMERRAAAGRPAAPVRVRPSSRARAFMLPVGLAAAAALVIFLPRVFREAPGGTDPGDVGAKGAPPAGVILVDTVVTAAGWSDSLSWDISLADGMTVEIRYPAGRADSPRARQLAERVAEVWREAGVSPDAMTVGPEPPRSPGRTLPDGAVRLIVRTPPPARR